MTVFWYALASVTVISILSFVGVISLSLGKRYLYNILHYLISFATGALLGSVFLHLIPKALQLNIEPIVIGFFILLGIIIFFILETMLHAQEHILPSIQAFGIMNLIGDALHNFIDGIAVGTSFFVSIPLGISTSIAIGLHEIPQEFSDFGILLHAGFSIRQALWYNFLSALTAIAGTVFVFFLHIHFQNAMKFLIPFTAGGFIYIAASTLIPELHKAKTSLAKTVAQLLFFTFGSLIMFGLALLD